MQEKIGDFLMDISQTYPIKTGINAERVLEDARTYLIGKLYKKEIDFIKAKNLLFDNYDKRTFPDPKTLYSYLAQCEIKNYHECESEGSLIVLTLPNGVKYQFTVTACGRSLGAIKDEIKEKYGAFPKIETYPAGTVIIGDKVFTT